MAVFHEKHGAVRDQKRSTLGDVLALRLSDGFEEKPGMLAGHGAPRFQLRKGQKNIDTPCIEVPASLARSGFSVNCFFNLLCYYTPMKKLAIIDTFALLHRAYHAIPPTLTTKDGLMVNAAYGFSAILLRLMKELKPDYIVAAFDLPGETFRHKEYKEYKAQREAPDKDFIDQISIIEDILEALNIPKLGIPGYEADDVIGSVAAQCAKEKDLEVIIVSGDMDTLQLINKKVVVYTMRQSINDTLIYNEAAVKARFELTPKQIIDLKSLKGDASDNIPGVKGIGEKGAIDLLKNFDTLEGIYKNIESKKIKDRTRQLLKDQKDMAFQSKMLATIITDLKVKFDLEKANINNFDLAKVTKLFQKLEFKSLLAKLPNSNGSSIATAIAPAKKKATLVYEVIDTEAGMKKLAASLAREKMIAIDTETTGLDTLHAEILGSSISWGAKKAVFIHTRTAEQKDAFKKHLGPIIENEKIQKIGHNIKYDYQILSHFGLEMQGLYYDTLLAGYLLHPDRSLKIEELAFTYLGAQMQTLTDLVDAPADDKPKKKKNLDIKAIDPDKLAQYGAADADMCFRLYEKLEPLIKKEKLDLVLEKIDTPLIPILAHMEHDGILLDVPYLKIMEKELGKRVETLKKRIHGLAGSEFNIASPLQLKEILFEKLAIDSKGIKRKKTGLSTAADELEKLRTAHPIINLILEYRELTKLMNTYVTTLPDEIDIDDKRIHTDYNQTVAATGRLSSNNPNLQNIPVRTELGRAIRKAFIAPKGKVLISADYSQIELRLAAIISKDPTMLASFKKGEDIHARTAAEIHGIPLAKVTPDIRRTAKEVNFGVIYGLGSTGLSQRTGITRLEAKEFIEKYFGLYKKLKKYLDDTKSFAHAHGFVTTIYGRKRRLPEIYSSAPMLVAQAERMAINMPLQGTAADLMKLAMIACAREITNGTLPAKMLLQVHDELVFEVAKEDITKAANAIKQAMENVEKFEIPLAVDVKAGQNWAEMDEIEL